MLDYSFDTNKVFHFCHTTLISVDITGIKGEIKLNEQHRKHLQGCQTLL